MNFVNGTAVTVWSEKILREALNTAYDYDYVTGPDKYIYMTLILPRL